jgi:ABC-type lipoprotein export system ATPase subunit
MFITRLRLLGVNNLRQDLPLEGSLPQATQKRLLFRGGNGSGKTTILETIFCLWRSFGEWIDAARPEAIKEEWLQGAFAQADLAAVEFRGFDKKLDPLWIGIGKESFWKDLKKEHPKAHFAGLVVTNRQDHGKPGHVLELPDLDLLTVRQRVLVGKLIRPNIVYFPAESRMLRVSDAERARLVNLQDYLWTAQFTPTLDLDGLLTTVKAHAPDRYANAIVLINRLLGNQRKKLVLRRRAPRHEVEVALETGQLVHHAQDLLSSGEKQMVLMVAFAACLLQEGGILIADEPDLHIFPGTVKQLLDILFSLAEARHAQFIVAGHSRELWDWFSLRAEKVSLALAPGRKVVAK